MTLFGISCAQSQTRNGEHYGPVFVEHVDVCLDAGRICFGDRREAVVRVAGGVIGTKSADPQRQPEYALSQRLDVRVRLNGLKAGIQ